MEIPGTRRGLFLLAGGVVCLVLAGLLVSLFSGRWDSRPSGQVAPAPHSTRLALEGYPKPGQRGRRLARRMGHLYHGAVMRPGIPQAGGTRVYQAVEQAGASVRSRSGAFNVALRRGSPCMSAW